MGDNVDQIRSTLKESVRRVMFLVDRLQQDVRQQYQAPTPPTFGDWNRPDMFYRDHQNLYYGRQNVDDTRYQHYREPQWQSKAHDQPSESYHLERESPLDEVKSMINKVLEKQERHLAATEIDPNESNKENSEFDELKTMLQQVIISQKETAARMESMFNELDSKLDTLSSHVKKLDTQNALTTEHVNTLLRSPEGHSQVEHEEAVTLKSDTLQPHHENKLETTEVSNLITSDSSTNSSSFAEIGSTEAPVRRSVFKRSDLRSFTTPQEKHDYIPKVLYPSALDKPKILGNPISSVAICSNVKACSPEPTRHTKPWFEESYLHNCQLSC